MIKRLGLHTMIEFEGCPASILNDHSLLREVLLLAAREGGNTILKDCFHQFSPHGVTGVVLLAESHLAIHTWPEHGYAAVDFFTCSSTIDIEKMEHCLRIGLQAGSATLKKIERGMRLHPPSDDPAVTWQSPLTRM